MWYAFLTFCALNFKFSYKNSNSGFDFVSTSSHFKSEAIFIKIKRRNLQKMVSVLLLGLNCDLILEYRDIFILLTLKHMHKLD